MLDVFHFLLEDDATPMTKELAEVRNRFRVNMYPELYDVDYAKLTGQKQDDQSEPERELEPVLSTTDSSFTPPTPVSAQQPAPVPTRSTIQTRVRLDGPMGEDGGGQSFGNLAPSGGRVLNKGGNQIRASQPMTHKPFIPATDMEVNDDPFRPFKNLREVPQF